ncbi:head decoration protein [Rhodoplanes sp. TEM]|uniref:Head decoration protein n=1 Tax=Rhodoplanes tepidamans TaxID=200616 RepID=A0ABT5J648_RHOTP|nr:MULTISPECIES: head decoration protein [Rhodoplanes]MDC7784774.1 head decoration protein [Rhodoplanes tepidamans]MDC7982241.1 head decoration protein [Rhodoplanes sp. TEM]MDQ0356248.1 hypothetical protein [Rhodoplanes tepidamans]
MTVLKEGRHPGEFIINEADGTYCREAIVISSGAGKVEPGTVLGKITATGEYKPAAVGASDGSDKAAAINIYGVDATSADQKVAAIVRGPAEVNGNFLVFDASVDTAAEKATKLAELAAIGIIVR